MAIISKSLFSFSKKDEKIITHLQEVIPHKNWFVAGGYARAITDGDYNDVDIFFYDEESYKTAAAVLTKGEYVYVTPNADTIGYRDKSLQLVHKHFGTPKEIFESFDLNVCKVAILSDGSKYTDPTANNSLTVVKPNADSFTRFLKYAKRIYTNRKDRIDCIKAVIDQFAGCNDILEDYYQGAKRTSAANYEMYKAFKVSIYSEVQSYLEEKIALQSPELLL